MRPAPRTAAMVVLATLLMVFVVVASLWAVGQVRGASEARRRTNEILESGAAFLSALKDAEAAQRGFALTGDEAYLEPFHEANSHLPIELEQWRGRTQLPSARAHLDALVPLLDAKLAELARVVEYRRQGNLAAVVAAVTEEDGKRLTDAIRSELLAYVQIEKGGLAAREISFQLNMRRLFTFIILASLSSMLFALSFAVLMHRESQHRHEATLNLETQRLLGLQEELNRQLQAALAKLREDEEKLSVTLNSIGDAVIATDTEGRITLLNPRAEALTGWSKAEAERLPVAEVFHIISQESRESSLLPITKTLAEGTTQSLMRGTLLVARDGREIAIADSCAPIRGHDGRVIGAVLVFRDVTAESAATQAVHDSTALIHTILNTVVDGIVTLRASDTIIETVNPAAERMFGYAPSALVGQDISLLIPELDRKQNNGFLEYYSASDQDRTAGIGHEVAGRRKDGSIIPLEISLSEMGLGGKRYFTGIFRDITARKLAEEALLEGGALQSAIFNSANYSSIATDARGVIQIFNVGAERMLGYLASEVINKITPADISDPGELILRAKALSMELETTITPGFEALVFKASRGIEDIYELTYIRQDGSRFPAIVSVTALRDVQGCVIGYLLIGTDNTARKLVEAEQERLGQRLRDSQFYARSLFESNVDALMTTDPSGFITDINKQMETLTGCTRDELIGAPFKSYFTDPVRAEAAIQQALSDKKITNYELTCHARNGKETVVSFNATTFFDRDRNLQGVFAAARDVTEAKHLDLVLQEKNLELEGATAAAEKANLAKSEFLSSMSHELRSPLNAILGFAQLMESDPLPPTLTQQGSLSEILRAGWHLLKLIDQILDLAKIESGRVPLSQEPVSLAEVMLECQSMTEHQAQQRGIRITFPRFEEPCFISADHTRVKQVVVNLLSNAIKYNALEGRVVVTCSRTLAGRVRVSIRDTGPGLHPDQLLQLFQAFNRLGQEAGREEGSGIGLVVARRLVELMGGEIGVESIVGVGSEFWFELASVAEPELPPESGEAARFTQPRVTRTAGQHTLLYIEDNSANLKLVQQIVARHPDLRLLTAENGDRGIELAHEQQPDLILMDINLPDINGFDALKVLREDPETADILVIALSANAMPLDIERAHRAGFFRYITKPIQIHDFMEALDGALEFAEHSPRARSVDGSIP